MKRIGLFVLTNLAVLLLISLVVKLLGLDRWLAFHGLPLGSLLLYSALVGGLGSIISLLLSKSMALRSTGAYVIEQPQSDIEHWLQQTVWRLAEQAGIGKPDVAIYQGAANAFATGANRNHALVAVSSGLLDELSPEEVEAVLAHEIGHVANGDMITLSLLQGVLNTFVVFLATVIGRLVDSALSGHRNQNSGPGVGYWLVTMLAQMLLGVLASLIVFWFSRQREFGADAAAAQLIGPRPMIAALERLAQLSGKPTDLPEDLRAFGIRGRVASLFSTHPPLAVRIARLRQPG